MFTLLKFIFLLSASFDHPCPLLDGVSTDTVANSRMTKCKRGFHGNLISVGTLHAGHEKFARTKVHMCSQRRDILQPLLEFAEPRTRIVATTLAIFYISLSSRITNTWSFFFVRATLNIEFLSVYFQDFTVTVIVNRLFYHPRLGQLPSPAALLPFLVLPTLVDGRKFVSYSDASLLRHRKASTQTHSDAGSRLAPKWTKPLL